MASDDLCLWTRGLTRFDTVEKIQAVIDYLQSPRRLPNLPFTFGATLREESA